MCALLLAAMNFEVSFTPSLCFSRHLARSLTHIQRILDMETTVSLSCLKSCFSFALIVDPCWGINCGGEAEDLYFSFLVRV